jgi:hypothetical protein
MCGDMGHGELIARILGYADGAGVLSHVCRQPRHCGGFPGLPDVILAGERGVLWAEVKTGSGTTTAEQDLWGWTLNRGAGNGLWAVWRPADWDSGRIRRAISALR